MRKEDEVCLQKTVQGDMVSLISRLKQVLDQKRN